MEKLNDDDLEKSESNSDFHNETCIIRHLSPSVCLSGINAWIYYSMTENIAHTIKL